MDAFAELVGRLVNIVLLFTGPDSWIASDEYNNFVRDIKNLGYITIAIIVILLLIIVGVINSKQKLKKGIQ